MWTSGRLVLVLANFLQKICESVYGRNQANSSALGKTAAPAPTPQELQ